MDEGRRNPPSGKGGMNRERAEAAFCEELLSCFVCHKIYFTRRPIRVRTARRERRHVCIECSQTLKCSVCNRPVTAKISVLVENLQELPSGFLCPVCRERVFLGLKPRPKGFRGRLRSALSSALEFLRRIGNIRFRSGKGTR